MPCMIAPESISSMCESKRDVSYPILVLQWSARVDVGKLIKRQGKSPNTRMRHQHERGRGSARIIHR